MSDFDVSKYELDETATLTVQNAKGDDELIGEDGKNPVQIVLYGGGSRQAVKALHRAGQAMAQRSMGMIRGKLSKHAAEEAEQEQVEKLVACTHSIINFPVAAPDLYSNPKLGYITKQVTRFLDDDANFAKASTNSSRSTSDKTLG